MPFYEYECSNCKFYVEALQKVTDAPMVKCPSCGKDSLQRLISAPVFRLKGSGWYETDFKSDKENKRNLVGADDKEPAAASADSDDKKIKVRASKALKKAVAKKKGKKASGKASKPTASVAKSANKPAQKPAKNPVKRVAKKAPAKKKPLAKKPGAKKTPKKTAKKAARKK